MQSGNPVGNNPVDKAADSDSVLADVGAESAAPRATHSLLQAFFMRTGCGVNEGDEPTEKSLPVKLVRPAIESVVALGYAGAATPFFERTTNPLYYIFHPFTVATGVLLFNVPSRKLDDWYPRMRNLLNAMRALLFASLAGLTQNALVHEGGHAGMGTLFYNNAQPKITLQPLGGGHTTINGGELSAWGERLGADNSHILFSTGGTIATMLWNYVSLIAAQAIPDPEIKLYLRLSVLVSLTQSVCYALSALWDCESDRNDFCFLRKHDVSPYLMAALVVGSALLLQVLCSSVAYCCTRNNKEPEAVEEVEEDLKPLLTK